MVRHTGASLMVDVCSGGHWDGGAASADEDNDALARRQAEHARTVGQHSSVRHASWTRPTAISSVRVVTFAGAGEDVCLCKHVAEVSVAHIKKQRQPERSSTDPARNCKQEINVRQYATRVERCRRSEHFLVSFVDDRTHRRRWSSDVRVQGLRAPISHRPPV